MTRPKALKRWQRLKNSPNTTSYTNRKGRLCLPLDVDRSVLASESVELSISKRRLTKQPTDADEGEMDKLVTGHDMSIAEQDAASVGGSKALATTATIVVDSDKDDDDGEQPFRLLSQDVDFEVGLPNGGLGRHHVQRQARQQQGGQHCPPCLHTAIRLHATR